MIKNTRQEFSIKLSPVNEPEELEKLLNNMAKKGWELYSLHETEIDEEPQYNCIFTREAENTDDEEFIEDLSGFKSQMERMMSVKETPYNLCVDIQKKIAEKKEKIEDIKSFLDTAKEDERQVLNEEMSKELELLEELKKQLNKLVSPSSMAELLGEERISINLSEELYVLNNYEEQNNLLAQTVRVREDLIKELGYILPKIKFEEDAGLEAFEFTINIHGTPVIKSFAYPNYLMFFEHELNLKRLPKNSFRDVDLITNRKIVWIDKKHTKDFWVNGMDSVDFITRYLKHFAIRYVNEILNYSDINRYIEIVAKNNSFLVDSILGDYISVSELKYIFAQLIREKVSVKDIINIFERINDFSDEPTKADLLDKLRICFARQISASLANKDNEIEVFEIGEDTLKILEKETIKGEEDGIIRLESSKFKKFIKKLAVLSVEQDIILLAPQEFRHLLFVLISETFMDIPVICPEEIAPEYDLRIVDTV